MGFANGPLDFQRSDSGSGCAKSQRGVVRSAKALSSGIKWWRDHAKAKSSQPYTTHSKSRALKHTQDRTPATIDAYTPPQRPAW